MSFVIGMTSFFPRCQNSKHAWSIMKDWKWNELSQFSSQVKRESYLIFTMSVASTQTMRQGVCGLERMSNLWERKVVAVSFMSRTWSTLRQVVLSFRILMARLLGMLAKSFIQALMEMHGGIVSNSSPRWRMQLKFSRQLTQTSRLFLFLTNLRHMPHFHLTH